MAVLSKCFYATVPGDPHVPEQDADLNVLFVMVAPFADGTAKLRGRRKMALCQKCGCYYDYENLTDPVNP